ncbi:MAG: arginine deiminase family protein, partial [Myxococcota bacterium]
VILSNGSEAASIYEIDLHADQLVPKHCPDGLLPALKRHNIDLQPIFCGGNDPVFQQREQWTDGANALAIAPGVLTLYAQNSATAEALDQAGFNVISAESVLFGREDLHMEQPKRTCILLSCHEISRARGGPHCLSHPLKRDRIKS